MKEPSAPPGDGLPGRQCPPDSGPDPALRPATPGVPQLRTLLLTDLVDSTALVERLGDAPASELFLAHDRLVLALQQRWRGRLIDRSDGLLLLFERPIDGLGFALDYARGLAGLGAERQLDLRARAGLHVGEVLIWRNSEEAVCFGAKPLEVEGLAKPMAARLMAIARPGQILLSAVAAPLAHRAARELGERGQHLLWKAWGRWRLRGVPEAQEIFEVGEPGLAPLRRPASTPKAWRDLPLWRRPAALVAEAALLGVAALVLWAATRPEPAIAFHQRDWVVVGDLRNLTGQVTLDDSLAQAFRISLEQSRHVNVLSDLKVRNTLVRMRRAPNTVLDRAIASEIALRDGARAVILPTVAEVGGRVRFSAEVIDPHTQTTVYAESADGKGVESVLGSIDTVTASLRGRLGEAVHSIEHDSAPLPEVTTTNLDALRAYALGQKSFGRSSYTDALRFYARATELDPRFALAWLGQMRVHYANVDAPAAVVALRRAQALRERMPPREALYLEAWAARFDQPAAVTGKWIELARLYPDFGPAQSNAAMMLGNENRHREALAYATAALTVHGVDTGIDHDSAGRAHLALEHYPEAARAFDQAVASGYASSARRRMAVEAARRNFAAAERRQKALPRDDPYAYLERTSLALDQGHWTQAQAFARRGLQLAGPDGLASRAFLIPAAVADWRAGDTRRSLKQVETALRLSLQVLARGNDPDAEEDATIAITAALLAQRLGKPGHADRVLAFLDAHASLTAIPNVARLSVILRAEQSRLAGNPQRAAELLQSLLDGNEPYQAHVALMSAYADAGRHGQAADEARWLRRRRGLAYGELDCGYCRQAMNVADSNLAAEREREWVRQSTRPGAGD